MYRQKKTSFKLVVQRPGTNQKRHMQETARPEENNSEGYLLHHGNKLKLDIDGNFEYPPYIAPKIIKTDEFAANLKIVSVKLPNSVKEIGARAFYCCKYLIYVDFGASLEKIGKQAFQVTDLFEVKFPRSISLIEEEAFSSEIKTIVFEESDKVVTIKKNAFASRVIEKLVLPIHGLISFNSFDQLTVLVITNTLLKTGVQCYASTTHIHFDDNLNINPFTRISSRELPNLRSITIPEFVEVIPQGSLRGLSKLEEIRFTGESKLRKIESHAFAKCKKLKEIQLPRRLLEIQDKAFYRCSLLETVWFEDIGSIPSIGENVFKECNLKISQIQFNRRIDKKVPLIFSTSFNRQIVYFNMEIPFKKLMNFRDNFNNKALIRLRKIEIINGVDQNTLENLAPFFKRNIDRKVVQINFISGSEYCVKNTIYTIQSSEVLMRAKKYSKRFIIRRGTEFIAKKAFNGCVLTRIRIPDSVRVIGPCAFRDCNNLKIVIISKNVKIIPTGCFYGCKRLLFVYFGKESQLRKIENRAFASTIIKKLILPSSEVEIGNESLPRTVKILMNNDKQIITIEDKWISRKII